jgi:hypothetical protein
MQITLIPVNEEEQQSARAALSLVPVDPLEDFDAFNAIEDEKEARGYDPDDHGIAGKLWGAVKTVVGDAVNAGKAVGTLATTLTPGGNNAEALALVTQTGGKLLSNYSTLGKGAATAVERRIYDAVGALNSGLEPEMKKLSRKAAWDFQREARSAEQFTDQFNQHLETIFPQALAGLGSVPVNNDEARGLSMFADPANLVPAGAAAKWTSQVPLRGAVRAANAAWKEASREVALAGAQRESATLLLKPGLEGAERAKVRSVILEAGDRHRLAQARQSQARAALVATTQEQRAIIDSIATQASELPLVTQGASLAARGAGAVLERGGQLLEKVAEAPQRLAQAVAGGADETARQSIAEGVRNVASGFGIVPAAAGIAGRTATSAGRNLAIFGRLLAEAESQLPFFKRLARETDGLSGWGASLVDQSGMGQLVAPWGRMSAEASRGLPFAATTGYAGSGGEMDGALQSAAGGAVFGLAGAGYGQWRRFATDTAFRQRQAGDVARYKQTLPTDDARGFFNRLPPADQAALATMQLAHPDLRVQYSKLGDKRPSFYYAAEDGPVAVVNLDTKDPLPAVVAHEIGHHVEKHDLGSAISSVLLGDPLVNRPGLFTEMDATGKPVRKPDGSYATNAEFAALREAYNGRLAALGDKMGEVMRPRTDEQIASEVFAEQAAGYLLGRDGQLNRDLRSNIWTRAIAGVAGSQFVTNTPTVRSILGKLGAPIDVQSKRVAGSGLFPGGLPASKDLQRLISDYHRKSSRGAVPAFDDEPGGTRYTIGEVFQHPEILQKLFDGTDDVRRDAKGQVMRDREGRPMFTTAAEQKQQRAELAGAIASWLEKNPTAAGDGTVAAVPRYEKMGEGGAVQEGWVVPALPDALLNDLRDMGKFNPVQIEHLRAASQMVREGRGQSGLFFYQPATRAGRSSQYRGLSGDWRTETPYAIFVSKQGNVLLRTVSREKLIANAQDLIGAKRAQLWGNNLGALVADIDRYLANHAAGKPGSDGLGIEKRDQINALFGIGTKMNAGANPVMESSPRAPIVIRSRRLDRINRFVPVEQTFPTNYDKLNRNLRPEDFGAESPRPDPLLKFANDAVAPGDNEMRTMALAPVAAQEAQRLQKLVGRPLVGYHHTIDNYAVRHMLKEHGNVAREAARGQIALTPEDIARIPEIISSPDSVEAAPNSRQGKQGIRYIKSLDGTVYYVEEIRTGRKQLAAATMYKREGPGRRMPAPGGASPAKTPEAFPRPDGNLVP